MHSSDRAVLGEPPRAGCVVDAGSVVSAVRSGDQAEKRPAKTGGHSAQVIAQAHTFDGTGTVLVAALRPDHGRRARGVSGHHDDAERGEALELATLMLLERLTPTERAAYVLREAFGYPYAQIGEVLQIQEDNARQLVARARKHIAAERRAPVDSAQQKRLLEALVAAARQGDLQRLERLLAEDAVSYTDGNGMRGASRVPVHGRQTVSRFLRAFAPTFWPGTALTWIEANGAPSVRISRDGTVVALLAIRASVDGIDS